MSPLRMLPRLLPCCLIVVVACSPEARPPQAGRDAFWFEGARLLVGDGTEPLESSAFLVEGGTIAWVGHQGERQPPEGVTRVDLTGKTVMPALIDGHNHIGLSNFRDGSNSKANYTRENLVDQLERYAYYGTGTTLSMGLEADPELAYRLRDEVIPNAARFLTVGKGIAATSMAGPPTEARLGIPYGAATEEDGRKEVQELHARGVKFVKIWVDDREGAVPKLKPNVYRAIIGEAHANGQQVLAHLGRTSALEDAKDLFRAGIDGFVHTVRDRDVDEEYLKLVKAHPKVWTGPNMPGPGVTEDDVSSLAETLPASQIERMRQEIERRKASGDTAPNELFQLHCRNLRKIHDAGMTIGLGTDGTGDGFGAHVQLASYARCGMTPHEAIVAGTGTNARILGLDRIGTVAAGKEADFVVLDANPLDNILNTRRISRVYVRGKEIDRKALRAKLTGASSEATRAAGGQAPATTGGAPTVAAKTAPAPKTPWGEPDLQGIWSRGADVPLQRPTKYGNREFFTDEERAELDRQIAGIIGRDSTASRRAPGTERDVNSEFSQAPFTVHLPIGRRTSLIVDPPDGRIPPLTPEAQKARDVLRQFQLALLQPTAACKEKHPGCAGGKYGPVSPRRRETPPMYLSGAGGGIINRADGPEDRSLNERCLGGPLPDFGSFVGGFTRIVQAPGQISIFHDIGAGQGRARNIPITMAPHLPATLRQWWGDSRGRWEGDTLVVDIANFSPKTDFQGAHGNLHLVERWTRLDADTIEYAVTIDDPTTWTRSWTAKQELKKQSDAANQIYYEPRCHEGNYGLPALLLGARVAERAFAEGRGPDPATLCTVIAGCGGFVRGGFADEGPDADPLP